MIYSTFTELWILLEFVQYNKHLALSYMFTVVTVVGLHLSVLALSTISWQSSGVSILDMYSVGNCASGTGWSNKIGAHKVESTGILWLGLQWSSDRGTLPLTFCPAKQGRKRRTKHLHHLNLLAIPKLTQTPVSLVNVRSHKTFVSIWSLQWWPSCKPVVTVSA